MKKSAIQNLLFLLLFSVQFNLSAQSWQWNSKVSSSDGLRKMAHDNFNNIYLYSATPYGQYSDTIKKINTIGQLISQLVLPSNAHVTSLVTYSNNVLYLGGYFYGTVTLGNTTYTATAQDLWLARYDSNFSLQWFKTASGNGNEGISDMCLKGSDLVITGTADDTLTFLGQYFPKQKQEDLFIAKVSNTGTLQALKFATGTSTLQQQSYSQGGECQTDPAGNIYLLCTTHGKNMLDTFSLGYWVPYGSYYPYYTYLIKLSPNLQPQSSLKLDECIYYCYGHRNLTTNSFGECFTIQDIYYGQSGNDDQWSIIHKVSSTGSVTNTYRHRLDRNSFIGDMGLDDCDNLYFTGYWRNDIYNAQKHQSFILGQLTRSLTLNWLYQDSTANNFVNGTGLSVLGFNDCFVSGLFNDSTFFASAITSNTNGAGFFARTLNTTTVVCNLTSTVSTVGLQTTNLTNTDYYFYPNPSNGHLYWFSGEIADQALIYSSQGNLLKAYQLRNNSLDLTELSEGLYIIELMKNNFSIQKQKVIITK